MQSVLISVGKQKERYWQDAAKEYTKRLRRFTSLDEVQIPDLPEPNQASQAQLDQIIFQEGEMILQKIKPGDFVVALAIAGKPCTSEEFSAFLQERKLMGQRLVFVIGGSLGLSPGVLKRADKLLSFSPMTFPHQLVKVMLLEQWYRGEKIAANERYHK